MSPARSELLDLAAEVFDDFPTFCSLLDIRTKSGGIIPFDYEKWHDEQRAFEGQRTGNDIVVKPRQIGFSTLELARDLRFAIVNGGTNTLVVGHDKDLVEQLFLTIKIMAGGLKRRNLLPPTKYDNVRELVFADRGSAIRVVESGQTKKSAQKKGRSGAIHRLHATEQAFWGEPKETMAALRGASEGAEVINESTPNGVGGVYYDVVQAALHGEGQAKLHFFPWWKHARYHAPCLPGFDPKPRDKWEEKLRAFGVSDQQIAWWRSKVDAPDFGLEKTLQEYPESIETCFRASGRMFFAPDSLDAIAGRVRAPLRRVEVVWEGRHLGWLLVFEEPRKNAIPGDYVVGADVAEGVDEDASSAHVLDRASGATVATMHSAMIEPGDFGLALAVIGRLYGMADVAPERNNHGHATIRALQREAKYLRIYKHADKKLGWRTDLATRPPLFDELARAIREKSTHTPDSRTLAECRTIIIDEDGKPRARASCHDDCYVSWAIAWQVRSKPRWKPEGFHISNL